MEQLVLALTNRPIMAMWLDHCFHLVPDWRLVAAVQRASKTAGQAFETHLPRAVVLDIDGDAAECLSVTRFLRPAHPDVTLIATSCCRSNHDRLLSELMRSDLAGYVLCDRDAEHCAAELMNALRAPRLWAAEPASRTLKHVGEDSFTISAVDQQLVRLCSQGLHYEEVGRVMGLSERMVRYHLKALRARSGARTTRELVTRAAELNLLEPEETVAASVASGLTQRIGPSSLLDSTRGR